MEQNVVQINCGITINIYEIHIYMKKIIFGIPLHVAVKMENI